MVNGVELEFRKILQRLHVEVYPVTLRQMQTVGTCSNQLVNMHHLAGWLHMQIIGTCSDQSVGMHHLVGFPFPLDFKSDMVNCKNHKGHSKTRLCMDAF